MMRILEKRWLWIFLAVGFVVIWYSGSAFAAESSANKPILDSVVNTFKTESMKWVYYLQQRAKWLFWVLAGISCVLRFAPLFFSGARTDFGDLMREVVMWVLGTLFFYWLLTLACVEGKDSLIGMIIDSFVKMGVGASKGSSVGGAADSLSPSGIISLGLKLMEHTVSKISLITVGTSFSLAIAALATLVIFFLIAAKMAVILVGAWFTAYGGLILLAFGASQFTKDTTLSYLKGCLAMGVKIMVFCLIIGFGESYLTELGDQVMTLKGIEYEYTPVAGALNVQKVVSDLTPLPDIWVVLAISIILLILVSEVPDTVAGFVSGFGGVHSLGSSVSAGAAMYQASRAASMASAGAGNVIGAGSAVTSAIIQAREQNAANEGLFKGSSGAGAKSLIDGFGQALGTSAKDGALAFGVRTAGSVAKNLFSGALGTVGNKGSRSMMGGVAEVIKMNTAKEANNRSVSTGGGSGMSVNKVDNTQGTATKTGNISGATSTAGNSTINVSSKATASQSQAAGKDGGGVDAARTLESGSKNSLSSELNPTDNVGTLANGQTALSAVPPPLPTTAATNYMDTANLSAPLDSIDLNSQGLSDGGKEKIDGEN